MSELLSRLAAALACGRLLACRERLQGKEGVEAELNARRALKALGLDDACVLDYRAVSARIEALEETALAAGFRLAYVLWTTDGHIAWPSELPAPPGGWRGEIARKASLESYERWCQEAVPSVFRPVHVSNARGSDAVTTTPDPRAPVRSGTPQVPLVYVVFVESDAEWGAMVQEHLAPFAGQGRLTVWSGETSVGEHRRTRLDHALQNTEAALLIVSPAFLADEEVTKLVLPELCACRVPLFPVPARRGALAALPADLATLQPATPWDRPLQALKPSEVADVLTHVVEHLIHLLGV